jgi:hypothetical protein
VLSRFRYDQIFLTLLSPDMVRNSTRKPVELLHRVRDGRCGVFACNRPQLFHPLKYTVIRVLEGVDGTHELKSDNNAIVHRPFTPLDDICLFFYTIFIDSAPLLASVYEYIIVAHGFQIDAPTALLLPVWKDGTSSRACL